MSAARTAAAGVMILGLGLAIGVAVGMVLFGGQAGPRAAPDRGRAPVEPAGDASVADAPELREDRPRVRAPRERSGPAGDISSLLERAAAGIEPPEIPEGDGRIQGTVKTRAGKPVAGVEVKVLMQNSGRVAARPWNTRTLAERFESIVQGDRIRAATTRTTLSGPDGRYVLDGLPAAPHTVTGSSDDYRIVQSGQHRPHLTPDATVDLIADPVVTVPLEVSFEDGSEPDQVMVTFASGGGRIATSWTPSNRTAQVNPGTYTVSASSGEHMELTAEVPNLTLVHGVPAEPVALVLASRPGIAGRLVLPEGSPLPWVAVGAELIGPDTTPESVAAGQQKARVNQHEDYRYAITGLTPGRYLLVAWSLRRGDLLASREVTVGDEMALADLEVAGPDREDYLEIAATGPNGEHLSDLRVQLRFKNPRRNMDRGRNLVTRPEGVVWAKHLSAAETGGKTGTHSAVVSHASYGIAEVEYRPGPAARVQVAFQQPAFVDLTLVGASPELLSAGLTVNGTDASNRYSQGSGKADAEGRVRVGPMQPGGVRLTATTLTHRRSVILATHELTVTSGDNEARLTLPSLHTLRVECADPAALAGQSVGLRKRDGDSRSRWSISQSLPQSGKAVFRFVPEGKYEIRVGREKREITLPGNDLVRF